MNNFAIQHFHILYRTFITYIVFLSNTQIPWDRNKVLIAWAYTFSGKYKNTKKQDYASNAE